MWSVSKLKCFLTILSALLFLQLSQCADPVLTPQTVTDAAGNIADNTSTITWAPLPTGDAYKAGDASYDDGGLGPLYNFARSFVNSALPVDFPYDTVTDMQKGNFDVSKLKDLVLQSFLGYVVCIVIGFLFIIIFPIVGCCFCCCRCCGNCGGKMIQKRGPKSSMMRLIFSAVLLVLVIFTSVGLICTYVSNERFGKAINNFKDTADDNLGDIDTFTNNTIMQLKHIINKNVPFLTDVVFRDLENLGVILGIPVRDQLNTAGGLDAAFSSATALSSSISSTYTAFVNVNTSLNDLETAVTKLSNELSAVKTDIDTKTSPTVYTNDLVIGTDPSSFPDISGELSAIESANNQDMSSLVGTAKNEFNSIPERVQNETSSKVTDTKNKFNDYKSKLDPMFDKVMDIDENLKKSVNIDSMKDSLDSVTETAGKYDKYRWYGGVGLASLILLIMLLEFIGLAFGFCGSSGDDDPTERGCLGTAGGNMLMASVGFIFIFSPLLMLLTTITFMIGAPLEKFVCQPISDPDFAVFTELLDNGDLLYDGDGYFLGDALFQNSSIPLTVKGILQDCKAGKTAYTALKLDNLINLDDLTNFRSSMDIDSTIDSIESSIDFSSIEILTPELKKNLEDFNSSANVDFASFTGELDKNSTQTNLNDLADSLDASPGGLIPETTELRRIQTDTVPPVDAAKLDLKNKLTALETELAGVSASVSNALNKLQTSQDFVQNNGSGVVTDELKNLLDRIFGTVDSLVKDVTDGLDNELGKCTPVYNLYYSILVVGFCKYGIDILNGFWFTIGWCIFFFVPSAVFSVKLAKHFRKMKFADSNDAFKGVGCPSPKPMSGMGGKAPENHMFSPGHNKVGHADF